MVSVAVGIPWRGGCPVRERNMAYVRGRLLEDLPGVPVETVDSAPGRPFNRSGARNAVMRLFAGVDVVVVHDACEVTEREGLTEAIAGAADGQLWQPFTLNYGWTETQTEAVVKGEEPDGDPDLWGYGAPGGIWVMQPAAWWACGGMDERCEGWGAEDDIFMHCARAVTGATRTDHSAFHLWHPRDLVDHQNWTHREAGRDLSRRYADAARKPGAIQALIAENLACQDRGAQAS